MPNQTGQLGGFASSVVTTIATKTTQLQLLGKTDFLVIRASGGTVLGRSWALRVSILLRWGAVGGPAGMGDANVHIERAFQAEIARLLLHKVFKCGHKAGKKKQPQNTVQTQNEQTKHLEPLQFHETRHMIIWLQNQKISELNSFERLLSFPRKGGSIIIWGYNWRPNILVIWLLSGGCKFWGEMGSFEAMYGVPFWGGCGEGSFAESSNPNQKLFAQIIKESLVLQTL